MSHHSPPFDPMGSATADAGCRRAPSVTRAFAIGCMVAVAAACGATNEAVDTPQAPTPLIDAVTGEEVEVPADFTLEFDPPAPTAPPATPSEPSISEEVPTGPAPDTDAPAEPATEPTDPARTGEEHPLEQVVIDTVVSDPEAAPVLDEAASLACANTEFAMDALIEDSADRADRFAQAADWAGESAYGPINSFADQLADAPTGAEANDLVVAVLETCAAAGYEL